MSKKIYLFRHGETDWNKENRIQCSVDIELNEEGINQAIIVSNNLKEKGIQHIYSSPLKRAYKTAEILANKINVKIEIIENLKEMFGGDYEGKLKSEIMMEFGEEKYKKFFHGKDDGMDLSYPNGEKKRDVRERINKAIENICKNTNFDIIGISSHGFALGEFIKSSDFEDFSSLKNCEVIEAEYKNGEIKVLNRIKYEN